MPSSSASDADRSPDRGRQCAVSSCRAPALPTTTPLDIGDERVEVELCPYHANGLIRELDELYDEAAAAEIDEDEEDDDHDDELDRLRLIETAAHALVDLATKTKPAWAACDEFKALREVLVGRTGQEAANGR
jgi:hypothetical protein